MFGIVLWYDDKKGVGMVWCEDQGSLAYVNADTIRPAGMAELFKGALIRFDFAESCGVRTVKAIHGLTMSSSAIDLAEVLSGEADASAMKKKPDIRVVA